MPTFQITNYHILCYGSPAGYQDNRAQIALYENNTPVGYVRFHDPGMPFPNDSMVGRQIVMHQPTAMFQGILDILRNEKPVTFYFASNHAFLGTGGLEPVGEGE